MKKISLLAVLSFALTVSLFSQKDPKATEILDQLSAKTKAYTSIQADFKMSVKSDDVNEEQKGKITLMGDKYKYTIFGVTKICDGINIAEIVPMDEEIILKFFLRLNQYVSVSLIPTKNTYNGSNSR